MTGKIDKRSYKQARVSYPFSRFAVDERWVSVFDAINARCAAHVAGNVKGWKFKTKLRETDAGAFELTVSRIL